MGVVERAVALADAGRRGNGAADIIARTVNRHFDGQTLREPGGNRRGQGAAGTVRVPALDPSMAPSAMPRFGRKHVVHGIASEMPTFQQHRATAERQQRSAASCIAATLSIPYPARISASGRFGVSTAARGTRRRFSASIAVEFDQWRAAFGDHDRIEHERHLRRLLNECRGDGLDNGGIVQHTGLDRIGPDIIEHDFDLLPNEFGRDRQYPENT